MQDKKPRKRYVTSETVSLAIFVLFLVLGAVGDIIHGPWLD